MLDIIIKREKSPLCNGQDIGLDELRYTKFCHKVTTSTTPVFPQSIPPTSAACYYHSLRVYCQIQEWKGNEINQSEWGWKLQSGRYIAQRTSLSAAPAALLEIVKCNCKMGCKTGRCTCKRHGLECSPVCGECKGISCENSQVDLGDGGEDSLG